jgi:hypothetical protein
MAESKSIAALPVDCAEGEVEYWYVARDEQRGFGTLRGVPLSPNLPTRDLAKTALTEEVRSSFPGAYIARATVYFDLPRETAIYAELRAELEENARATNG